MATFNLTVHNGDHEPETDAFEAAMMTDARSQAVIMAGAMLKDADGHFWDQGAEWHIDVADDRGLLLYSIMIMGVNAPAASSS